ncbi:unnamed protein product [Arabis nemorensis]|uniref:Endonuclease/exonuclease/phosphatase domain-containing protein n=1 Tax=Arabis nemorensis TaxID=586526 RepID=A0A565BXN6_9BRAS|nr:unnamed protein product [Arabis nemorensis]
MIIYASNHVDSRRELWLELVVLSDSNELRGKPWIVLGDFNQVLHPTEHSKYSSVNVNRRIREFCNCLLEADLRDLNFRGNTYTWWNKRTAKPVAKKLDRILVNDQWNVDFPSAVATFGSPDFSDHASLSVVLDPLINRPRKSFKFYNYLLKNKEFLPLVSPLWYSFNVVGSVMFRVSQTYCT